MTPTATSKTQVVLKGHNYTLTKVTAEGNDVTPANTNLTTFDLSLLPGMHTIVANADVSCLFCSGGQEHVTDTKTFCVADLAGPPTALMTYTTISKNDQMSWDGSLTSSKVPLTLSLRQDTGLKVTRFILSRLGGTGSSLG